MHLTQLDIGLVCGYFFFIFVLAQFVSRVLGAVGGDTVEFGCGYGTFTLPAARRIADNSAFPSLPPRISSNLA